MTTVLASDTIRLVDRRKFTFRHEIKTIFVIFKGQLKPKEKLLMIYYTVV